MTHFVLFSDYIIINEMAHIHRVYLGAASFAIFTIYHIIMYYAYRLSCGRNTGGEAAAVNELCAERAIGYRINGGYHHHHIDGEPLSGERQK